jgi:hypothetical protein
MSARAAESSPRFVHLAAVGAVVVAVVVLGVVVGVACVHVPRFPEVHALTHTDVAARLLASAERRHSVVGVARAGLPGVGGAVMNATLDIAAAAPSRLSVAVRSFFEIPQQILVADGDVVTVYDATAGTPRFLRGPASERTLARMLGVPLWPDDAVAVLLGRAPLDVAGARPPPRVRLLGVDDERGTYSARIERAGRGALLVTARVRDDAVVAMEIWRGDGRPLVRATFSDFVDDNGIAFARRVELALVDAPAEEHAAIVLSLSAATWNPRSLPDTAFVLDVPPAASVEPL